MSSGPQRIQLRRTKGWRKPDGAVVVARPTRWGNPFVVGAFASIAVTDPDGIGHEVGAPLTADQAVACYRAMWEGLLTVGTSTHPEDLVWDAENRAALAELHGHDLACWCPLDAPCHADVLLELANR